MNRYEILLGKKFEENPVNSIWPRNYLDNDKRFRQEFGAEFVEPTCSVSDGRGNYCPDKPVYFLNNGKEIGLCERCYENYKRGLFDPRKQRKEYGKILYRIN